MDPSLEILGADDEAGTAFVSIVDGDARPLIHGSQSGFHVWMNLRARGVCPARLRLDRRITDVLTGELLSAQGETATLPRSPDDPNVYEFPSAFAFFLCPNTSGLQVRDRLVRVDMKVTDVAGRVAMASVNIVPTCMMSTQGGVYYDACLCICGAATGTPCPIPMVDAGE